MNANARRLQTPGVKRRNRLAITLLVLFVGCGVPLFLGIGMFGKIFVVPSDQEPLINSDVALQKTWCVSPGLITTQLTMTTDLVFARSSSINAIEKSSGKIIWSFDVVDDAWRVPPVVHDNSVIVVSANSQAVSRLNATTGQIIWSVSEPLAGTTYAKAMTIGNSNIYIVWHNHGLVSYDLETGQSLWNSNYGDGRTYALAVADQDDRVYISEGEKLTALDKGGSVLWEYTGMDIIRALTYSRNTLYFFEGDALTALMAEDRKLKWEIPFRGKYRVAIEGDNLYASGLGGKIISADTLSGKVWWVVSLKTSATLQTAAVYGDKLFVESLDDGLIFVLNSKTGAQTGTIGVAAQISEPNPYYGLGPTSNGDMLLIPSGSVLCSFR